MRKYVVTSASSLSSSETAGMSCVHLIYRVGNGGMLQRAQTNISSRKSLMGIYDSGGFGSAEAEKLSKDIMLELSKRNYNGVLLDFSPNGSDVLKVQRLCELLIRKNITVFMPYELSSLSNEAKIIVPMSVSGGSLKEMLESVTERIPPQRLCVEIRRSCNDFTMPSYDTDGKQINSEQLQKIMSDHSPIPYFSEVLGCKYFTYRINGESHFILFDDFDTAVYKLRLASSLNLFAAFIIYSEWGHVSKQIVS